MTIERPMFPPRADAAVSCEIIQFSAIAGLSKKDRKQIARAAILGRPSRVEIEQVQPGRDEGETITLRNKHLRDARKDAWRKADSIRSYWHARLKFEDAISSAQNHGAAEGDAHPPHNPDDRWTILANYRQAIAQQLLTPAPDTAAIAWKKAALAGGQHEYTGVKSERIERAIADDLAFLAAHPVRRSNSETMARRCEFKEAMRQRIRDIAASRDLSDEEIKPALTLKHHEIANFTEKHGVNLEWLLEGKGRIFKKDPIRLSPIMTGDEFAAVVTTMPMADQQAIGAMLRDLSQERDQ
jgi:hypothetical protein